MTDQERIADLEKQVAELTKLLHEALARQIVVLPSFPSIASTHPLTPITQPYKLPYTTCGQGYSTDGVTPLAPIM